jgi:hypothetical protein
MTGATGLQAAQYAQFCAAGAAVYLSQRGCTRLCGRRQVLQVSSLRGTVLGQWVRCLWPAARLPAAADVGASDAPTSLYIFENTHCRQFITHKAGLKTKARALQR